MKKSVLLGVTLAAMALPNLAAANCGHTNGSYTVSVSYTHLTLPTILLV